MRVLETLLVLYWWRHNRINSPPLTSKKPRIKSFIVHTSASRETENVVNLTQVVHT
jgi:hypothetical protein